MSNETSTTRSSREAQARNPKFFASLPKMKFRMTVPHPTKTGGTCEQSEFKVREIQPAEVLSVRIVEDEVSGNPTYCVVTLDGQKHLVPVDEKSRAAALASQAAANKTARADETAAGPRHARNAVSLAPEKVEA